MNIDSDTLQQMQTYFTSFKEVEIVYLFGSVAENRARLNSDIDFAVLFNEETDKDKIFNFRIKIIGKLMDILHRNDVEVVVLNSSGPAFQQEAIKNRKEIFVRSNLKRIEFEAQAMMSYFDRLFYIKRHTQMALGHSL